MFPKVKTSEEEKKRSEEIVNLLYSFASNRPNQFGAYKVYVAEEVDELLSHFDADLKESIEADHLDADHLTRLA